MLSYSVMLLYYLIPHLLFMCMIFLSTMRITTNQDNIINCLSLMFDLFVLCVQVYVLGPKHDPSTVLSLLSEDKESDQEEIKKFKHIHICEVSARHCCKLVLKMQRLGVTTALDVMSNYCSAKI